MKKFLFILACFLSISVVSQAQNLPYKGNLYLEGSAGIGFTFSSKYDNCLSTSFAIGTFVKQNAAIALSVSYHRLFNSCRTSNLISVGPKFMHRVYSSEHFDAFIGAGADVGFGSKNSTKFVQAFGEPNISAEVDYKVGKWSIGLVPEYRLCLPINYTNKNDHFSILSALLRLRYSFDL